MVPTAVPPDHPEYYIQKAKTIVAAHPGRDLRRPALQRRQPRGALPHHRARALGADGGQDHALRVLAGHRRHGHGRGALPEGEEPEGPRGRGRPRGLDLQRVRADPREGPGPAVQGRGHRRRQDPDLARLLRGRRVDHGLGRRGLPRRAASHARGGHLHRRLGRAQRGDRARGGASRRRSRGLRRHDPLRHRRALPVEALRRRLDAREPDARGRAGDRGPAAAPPPGGAAAARLGGAGREPAPGAQPDQHLGHLAGAGRGRRRLRGLRHRGR